MANNVTDANFEEEVLKSKLPVLVDFWADWCGPCKLLGPIVDEFAKTHGDRVKVVKLNIEENPKIPSGFGIRGIPTMMLFKNGELMDTKVGVVQKPALEQWVESLL